MISKTAEADRFAVDSGQPAAPLRGAAARAKKPRRWASILLALFVLTLGAHGWFAKTFAVSADYEPDGKVYLNFAHNLLAHGVYSPDDEPDRAPSYIRLPGYPVLIAAVFALCGDGNEAAVRGFQVLLAALTVAAVAWLAFLWEPIPARRSHAALIAFLLAAVCPFTAIYTGIILCETLTLFLAASLMLAATWAFRARSRRAAAGRWLVTGLAAGAAQLVRPESGLFAAAVGFTLVGFGLFEDFSSESHAEKTGWPWARMRCVVWQGAVFSAGFALTLTPWTARNALVFHRFAPLPPVNAAMPGEPDYSGFQAWYGTWADSERYLRPFYWGMTDDKSASVDELPPGAFDSAEERARTARLFDRYNAPPGPDAPPDAERAGITPELNAAFGQLARERAARAPWRQFVVLPLRRAVNLWFVPHTQYYDFDEPLFPLWEEGDDFKSRCWVLIFFALTCAYTALGLAGMWRLAKTRPPARAEAWRWLGLVVLVILPRWVYLATLEHTEPRYMVEIFPFLCVLGGLALAGRRAAGAGLWAYGSVNDADALAVPGGRA